MQQTIRFLGAIDSRLRRQSLHSTPKHSQKISHKFPFAKVLEFQPKKFKQYPHWLTEREDFFKFMYDNYEEKLLAIPKICEKKQKESDEKYFVNLYLSQIKIFQQLPPIIMQILLNNITTRYFKPGDIIHQDNQVLDFMAVIFVGSVQYLEGSKTIQKKQNSMIMTQAFYGKTHPEVRTKQQTILLTFPIQTYKQIQEKMLSDILEKEKDEIADLIKSDFFIELHLKDLKAKAFFQNMQLEFYFRGQTIAEAGELPKKFYLIFKGQILQKNHIYIREHNKWPLPHKRWEVRAVYNSFQNIDKLRKYNFFGDEEIINALRLKSTHVAETHVVLFSINKDAFIDSLTTEDFKRLKKYRNEHVNVNYNEFERSVRERVKSHHERKKIVHKAIDASFVNRREFPKQRLRLIDQFQKHMTKSIDIQLKEGQKIQDENEQIK